MSTTYQMSRDYEALYDLLCKGGEALGWLWGGSKYPSGVAIRMTKEGAEVLHVGFTVLHNDRDIFLSVCHELNLEWIAPSLPLAMSEEEIERISGEIAPCDLLQDGKWKRSEYRALRREGIEMGLRYANTRSKSLTVEKGRMFTESEVREMLIEMAESVVIGGIFKSGIRAIAAKHGLVLDPA